MAEKTVKVIIENNTGDGKVKKASIKLSGKFNGDKLKADVLKISELTEGEHEYIVYVINEKQQLTTKISSKCIIKVARGKNLRFPRHNYHSPPPPFVDWEKMANAFDDPVKN